MKRKALIIGNSGDRNNPNEYLEGVKQDVNNYKQFLQSNIGGDWYNDEIVLSLNDSKNELLRKIKQLNRENNDFIFILFSGHGSYSSLKECRKLYIYDDYIYEKDLVNLAKKQITILDTCANIEDDITTDSIVAQFESRNIYKFSKPYRKIYEKEIINCKNQQVILYSSSINESSGDDSELGGYFAYNLLKVSKKNNKDIFTTREAYLNAKELVQKKTNNEQNPQCKFIKSINILPFSIGE